LTNLTQAELHLKSLITTSIDREDDDDHIENKFRVKDNTREEHISWRRNDYKGN